MALILQFLRSGKLGFLEPDMVIGHVRAQLPDLEEQLLRTTKKRRIYDYGSLTLIFLKGRLNVIDLYFKGGQLRLPNPLLMGQVAESLPVEYEDFLNWLNAENLRSRPFTWTDELSALNLDSGVDVYFRGGKLYSMEGLSPELAADRREWLSTGNTADSANPG